MKQITDIQTVQSILLDISKEFLRICTKYNIPYYMQGGTMLGAVRHKGFIPWDDDVDFGVSRDNFMLLKQILPKELSKNYRMLKLSDSPSMIYDTIKIEDTRTALIEQYKEGYPFNLGINIDIFPLDKTNNKLGILSKNMIIQYLCKIQGYRFLSISSRPWGKRLLAIFIKIILCWTKRDTIFRIIDKFLIEKKGDYIINHYGTWQNIEMVPAPVMGTPTLYSFCDIKLLGPEDYDNYLKTIYGNYMELPPEEDRHYHILNVYWR